MQKIKQVVQVVFEIPKKKNKDKWKLCNRKLLV